MLSSLFTVAAHAVIPRRPKARPPRKSDVQHREQIQKIYGGPKGALLQVASTLSGNIDAAKKILGNREFDLRGLKSLLDVGSGSGQLALPLLRYADADAEIVCCDLSQPMLHQARERLASTRPQFAIADLCHLPFAPHSFDGILCGYVLEHIPDPRSALAELTRVLRPGGKLLLLTTEDNFFGSLTSRVWSCRAYNRSELRRHCRSVGLTWHHAFNVPRWHHLAWIDGICVELRRR